MSILEKEVVVTLSNKIIQHYEEKGYIIPRSKDKKGRMTVKKDTKITVSIDDLTESSCIKVTKVCDECGEHVIQTYDNIIRSRKKFGFDRCKNCAVSENGRQSGIATLENCISTVDPKFAKLFWNEEDAQRFSCGSSQKADFRCPDCGYKVKNKTINEVYKQGLSCPKCSDGFSYPEKFMTNLLHQLNIQFEPQKRFTWSLGKRYDFYVEALNCIIEVHGAQHYMEGFERYGGRTLEEEILNDECKLTLAKDNGVSEYIVIDARKSNEKYLKNSISNNEQFTKKFNVSNINWNECHEFSLSSLVKEVSELFNNGIQKRSEISKILKIASPTVYKYLKIGAEIGICNYDPVIARANSELGGKKNGVKIVQLTKQGELVAKFDSGHEAMRQTGVNNRDISSVCRGKRNYAGGFKWMFEEDYNKLS